MIDFSELSDAALLRFVGPPRPPHGFATCRRVSQDPEMWQAFHPDTLPLGGPKMPTCREALLAAIAITNPGAGNNNQGERPPNKEQP